MKLYRVEVPHYVAGLAVDANGTVAAAPPICRWAVGKNIQVVEAWAKKKGGSCRPNREETP